MFNNQLNVIICDFIAFRVIDFVLLKPLKGALLETWNTGGSKWQQEVTV